MSYYIQRSAERSIDTRNVCFELWLSCMFRFLKKNFRKKNNLKLFDSRIHVCDTCRWFFNVNNYHTWDTWMLHPNVSIVYQYFQNFYLYHDWLCFWICKFVFERRFNTFCYIYNLTKGFKYNKCFNIWIEGHFHISHLM